MKIPLTNKEIKIMDIQKRKSSFYKLLKENEDKLIMLTADPRKWQEIKMLIPTEIVEIRDIDHIQILPLVPIWLGVKDLEKLFEGFAEHKKYRRGE